MFPGVLERFGQSAAMIQRAAAICVSRPTICRNRSFGYRPLREQRRHATMTVSCGKSQARINYSSANWTGRQAYPRRSLARLMVSAKVKASSCVGK